MAVQVALAHKTRYSYDRPVLLGPQQVRLRPAPHCRTPILNYALAVAPAQHSLHWQQDPQANYLARLVFAEPTREFRIEVDLAAALATVNPFDFLLEPEAASWPFAYAPALARALHPYLEREACGPLFARCLAEIDRRPRATIEFLVALTRRIRERVAYTIRPEPGMQSCEETLALARGSCRDSAWLAAQLLRHLGVATRFVSGYLIELAGQPSFDGPAGPDGDFAGLHAWTEAYLPGAGWVGLDPTSGLLAAEGHIPLACTSEPESAAPVTGSVAPCEVRFDHAVTVTRIMPSA